MDRAPDDVDGVARDTGLGLGRDIEPEGVVGSSSP
jgi:hypothetical protein